MGKEILSPIEVKDTFLSDKDFNSIQDVILGNEFPWYYNEFITTDEEKKIGKEWLDDYQFIHVFYRDNQVSSDLFRILAPLVNKIEPVSILRVKANLGPRRENINKSSLHCDGDHSWGKREGAKGWYTSIFYLNTNNGYTYFEDGSKIHSRENRLVTFPCSMRHAGASCTDKKVRVVLNINYIK